METPITFSNPRRLATIQNWPNGGRHRCTARFEVESHPRLGERVTRRTTKKDGATWNKPKHTTYAFRFAIVDGSDGETHLLSASGCFNAITIWSSDCQHIVGRIWPPDSRHTELSRLVAARI